MDESRLVCLSEQPDVVCISEIWLDENILDSEISIKNYSVFRSDRNRHMVVALLCTSGIVCNVMYVTWIHGVWS